MRKLLPPYRAACALYKEGFRCSTGHSPGESEQCKWKCTHGMEIPHLHSPPPRQTSSSLWTQGTASTPPQQFSQPREGSEVLCQQTIPSPAAWDVNRPHRPALSWLGLLEEESHCSHLTLWCLQRSLQNSQPRVFSWVNAVLRAPGWKMQIQKIYPKKAKPLVVQQHYLLLFVISIVKF